MYRALNPDATVRNPRVLTPPGSLTCFSVHYDPRINPRAPLRLLHFTVPGALRRGGVEILDPIQREAITP